MGMFAILKIAFLLALRQRQFRGVQDLYRLGQAKNIPSSSFEVCSRELFKTERSRGGIESDSAMLEETLLHFLLLSLTKQKKPISLSSSVAFFRLSERRGDREKRKEDRPIGAGKLSFLFSFQVT